MHFLESYKPTSNNNAEVQLAAEGCELHAGVTSVTHGPLKDETHVCMGHTFAKRGKYNWI